MRLRGSVSSPTRPLYRADTGWWLLLLRGLAAIVFGLLTLLLPALTLGILVFLFGTFVLIDGALMLAVAMSAEIGGSRWWLVAAGLSGIAAGFAAFQWPAITASTLLVVIALWAIAVGVFQTVGAIELRRTLSNEWLLILGGAVSMLVGVIMLVAPGADAVALTWIIGAYAVAFGATLVGFSLRLRKEGFETA